MTPFRFLSHPLGSEATQTAAQQARNAQTSHDSAPAEGRDTNHHDSHARELFGIHLAPRPGTVRGHAVLLCNPFGQEAIRAHRLYRVLGDRLAAAGFDVMRFDYYGTGDSAGDDAEFDLHGAVADTVAAGHCLLQRSQAQRLSCLGLRLGGNIAALASSHGLKALDHLVLFEPVLDGTDYIGALERANADAMAGMFGSRWRVDPALRAFNLPDDHADVLGFAMRSECRAQIARSVNPQMPWPGKARHTTIVTHALAAFEALVANRDHAAAPRAVVMPSASDIDWATNSALNTAIVPRSYAEQALSALTEAAHA